MFRTGTSRLCLGNDWVIPRNRFLESLFLERGERAAYIDGFLADETVIELEQRSDARTSDDDERDDA